MANEYWNKKINNNFNNAAHSYSNYSLVQKYFANKLVHIKGIRTSNWKVV